MKFEEALEEFDNYLYQQSLEYQLSVNYGFLEVASPETKEKIEQDIKKIQDSLAEFKLRISAKSV